MIRAVFRRAIVQSAAQRAANFPKRCAERCTGVLASCGPRSTGVPFSTPDVSGTVGAALMTPGGKPRRPVNGPEMASRFESGSGSSFANRPPTTKADRGSSRCPPTTRAGRFRADPGRDLAWLRGGQSLRTEPGWTPSLVELRQAEVLGVRLKNAGQRTPSASCPRSPSALAPTGAAWPSQIALSVVAAGRDQHRQHRPADCPAPRQHGR